MPLILEPDIPDYSFQIVCLDFIERQGHTYLVVVNKYSNLALRMYFSTFDVAQILCTDGAKVYTSAEIMKFYNLWDIL